MNPVQIFRNSSLVGLFVIGAFSNSAGAGERALIELELINGGSMPISPAAVYTLTSDRLNPVAVGAVAPASLVPLCQMGNPDLLIADLQKVPGVSAVRLGVAPTLPGGELRVRLRSEDLVGKTLRVVAMYGKSKDICAQIVVRSDDLNRVIEGRVEEVSGTDRPIMTGAFHAPVVSEQSCSGTGSAIECLRSLSIANPEMESVKFFNGYLPELLTTVSNHFGSEEALGLQIAPAGTVQYRIHRAGQ